MKKILYIVFGISLLFVSCKKTPIPAEEPANPDFYFKGDLDGKEVNFSAGDDNYYMKASYFKDSITNVYVYKAALTQTACSTCGYGLTILINDANTSALNASMNVDQAIKVGKYTYNDDNLAPIYYYASFTPEITNQSGSSYNWQIDSTEIKNSYAVNEKIVKANKVVSVTLKYGDASGSCSNDFTKSFQPNNPIQLNISATKQQSSYGYNFYVSAISKWPIASYLWDFGDSHSSTLISPAHDYTTTGKKMVSLRVIDTHGDTCLSYYQVNVSESNAICDANFKATFTPIPNIFAFSAITILVSDASGKVYSSKGFSQPETSKFEIETIKSYNLNERNEPTKKLKVKFNCLLKNGNDVINLNNAEAVIAVSYK